MHHLHRLVVTECAAYFGSGPFARRHFCVHRDGPCRLYGDTPTRCRYLEEAVLPADEKGSAKAEYALAIEGGMRPPLAAYRKRGRCICCGNPFTSSSNRALYCSDQCRTQGERAKDRDLKRARRTPVLADS